MDNPIARIGQTNFRNKHVPFGIKQTDRLAHMLLVGKTGTGKSTVLANMMRSDLENGVGFALLDAHGDLAEQTLGLIPKRRFSDVIYINPTRPEFSPAINLLANNQPYLAVSEFLSIFRHLWPEFWGPRSEYLFRNALLLLVETFPGAHLGDVPNVLTDYGFRQTLMSKFPAGNLKQFWEREFEQYSKHFRSEAIAPILNKLGAVTLNPRLRPILCQRRTDIDVRELMDTGKILIVNLAKGAVGEDGSALLGSMLLSKLVLAALSRSDAPEEHRRFFGIYADEAHAFITESTVSLFAELRKFKVGATWATQYLTSLPENLCDGILGNVGTLLSFGLSGEDAEFLSKEFVPVLRSVDLVNLPTHNFYIKLRIDGVTSRPFSGETIKLAVVSSNEIHGEIRKFRNPVKENPIKLTQEKMQNQNTNTLF